jgi:phosphate transport system substrate-binding protein
MSFRVAAALNALLILGSASAALAEGKPTVDPKLPDYKPVEGVSGGLKAVGSDTMNNLMALWTEAFAAKHPGVRIEVEGKGSGTAPPALIEGTAQLGLMSRPMSAKEADQFVAKFGYKPTEIGVAVDVLAVFVHKDNPVNSLDLSQLDAVFGKTRRRGATADAVKWGDLGVTGALADRAISAYGRNSASGTYAYFKEHVLSKGDYKDSVKEQPGSSAVVQAVASDPAGIGYSGIGYVTKDVKVIALAIKAGDKPVAATMENAYSGDYPLARMLLIYVNKKPGTELDPLRKAFLTFALSKQGQEIVIRDGYIPLPAETAAGESAKLSGK